MVVIAGKAWNWQNLGGRIPLLNHSPWPMSSYSMNVTCGSFAPGKKKTPTGFQENLQSFNASGLWLSSIQLWWSSEQPPLISAIHRWRDSNHDDSFQNIINPKDYWTHLTPASYRFVHPSIGGSFRSLGTWTNLPTIGLSHRALSTPNVTGWSTRKNYSA